MTWSGWQIQKNISLLLKEFYENVRSKTPIGVWKKIILQRCEMIHLCIVKIQRTNTSLSIFNASPSIFKALLLQLYAYAAPLHIPPCLPSSLVPLCRYLKPFRRPLTPFHRHLRLSVSLDAFSSPWNAYHTSPFNSSPSTLMLCYHHLTLHDRLLVPLHRIYRLPIVI